MSRLGGVGRGERLVADREDHPVARRGRVRPVAPLVGGRRADREHVARRGADFGRGAERTAVGRAGRAHRRARVGRDRHLLEREVGIAVAVRVVGAVARQLRVPLLRDVVLLEERHEDNPAGDVARGALADLVVHDRVGELAVGALVVVAREPNLLHVVGALDPRGGGANLLNRGEQKADEDRDDRDHDEQLDQCEGAGVRMCAAHDAAPSSSVSGDRETRRWTWVGSGIRTG